MRIFRLSVFNIKKHKAESISIIILMTICMMLLNSSFTNLINIQGIFGRVISSLHGIENHFIIHEKDYYPEYDNVLQADERVSKFINVDCVASFATNYIDKNGEEAAQYFLFVNEEGERQIEDFNPVSTFTDEEIAQLAHPIYAPFYVKDTLGKSEGDIFTVIYNGKKYNFTIAGFAETSIYTDNMAYIKIIVGDEDFRALQQTIGRCYFLGFNTDGDVAEAVASDFIAYVEENTNNGEVLGIKAVFYEDLEMTSGAYIKTILIVMMIMALVVLISVLIMMCHQIVNDINEQIISIGVLEALGYMSKEISLSYIYEYLVLGLIGIILGNVASLFVNPSLFHIGELMTGHHLEMQYSVLPVLLIGLILLLFIVGISFMRSQVVKTYPPIMAFRKGIEDHHFDKNSLSLEKTKTNVHLRLALKGAISNTKQNIGVGICIIVVTIATLCCYILYSYCDDGMNAIKAVTGTEITDLRVSISKDTDVNLITEELLELPEVEKVTTTNDWFEATVIYKDYNMVPIIYEDYSVLTQLEPRTGRLPKHANEIMVSQVFATQNGLKTGDTVELKFGKIEKEYMICGVIPSMTNSGLNCYFTADGYKRIRPSYRPNVLELTLTEGTDRKQFTDWITHTYGRSMADALEDDCERDSFEARVRAEAEKRMATLMTAYGIGHIEYSIMVDGKMISGNSSIFKITSVMSLEDIIVNQLSSAVRAFSLGARVFMVIAVIVVMIIMFMIMESSVKKQWKELGIFKGMGYTSKELMLQLSFKILPVLGLGIFIGSVLAILLSQTFTIILGSVNINYGGIVLVDLLLLGFSYLAAYFGSRKIKKVSVYELMTE